MVIESNLALPGFVKDHSLQKERALFLPRADKFEDQFEGPFVRLRMLRDRTRLRKGFSLLSSDVKQHKDMFRSVALDRLERESTSFYDLPHRGEARSRQRQSFLDYLAKK